jgi:hypothetical protein
MPLRFDPDFSAARIDEAIDEVFAELKSTFLTLPKGEAFTNFETFDAGYEHLKRATGDFRNLSVEAITKAVFERPICLIVLRTILGFTPPEWAYETSARTGTRVDQGAARSIDKAVRAAPLVPRQDRGGTTDTRIRAMVAAAVEILTDGVGETDRDAIVHRLDKIDTAEGTRSIQPVADLGVPYSMLLYERLLGRPFAGHRDAVSDLVGEVVENAIETELSQAGVSFRKTKRAERVLGFDQAPDFIIPNEVNPAVIIEAKLSEDDGTARDKVARVQNLRRIRDNEEKSYEIVACIAGRGFKVRREDMRRLLEATDGKVFTLETIDRLLDSTRIRDFVTR